MKKYILLFIGIIFLVGCSIIREKKEKENYESQAIEEAKKYINNKYSISLTDSNIINVSIEKNPVNEWSWSPNGIATVTAKYNNRIFKIHLNYHYKNIEDYYDNYEQDDIIASIKSYYCDKLNISESNAKLYLTDEIVYAKHTNKKFSDAYSFINSMNVYPEQYIIILTNSELDEKKVDSVAGEFNNINLYVYRMSKDVNLSTYSNDALIETNDSLNITNSFFYNTNDLYVEDEYTCKKGGICIRHNYVISHLSDGLYVRSLKNDNITIQKIDVKKIKSYQSALDNCGANIRSTSAYKLSSTLIHSETFGNVDRGLYVYNTDVRLNPIFINDRVNCNGLYNKSYYRLSNGSAYIIIAE